MDLHKGGRAHVDRGEGAQKRDFFVDVINGWPLMFVYTFLIFSLRLLIVRVDNHTSQVFYSLQSLYMNYYGADFNGRNTCRFL